jgi:hypothetical protein
MEKNYKIDVNQKLQGESAPKSDKKKRNLAPIPVQMNPAMDESLIPSLKSP